MKSKQSYDWNLRYQRPWDSHRGELGDCRSGHYLWWLPRNARLFDYPRLSLAAFLETSNLSIEWLLRKQKKNFNKFRSLSKLFLFTFVFLALRISPRHFSQHFFATERPRLNWAAKMIQRVVHLVWENRYKLAAYIPRTLASNFIESEALFQNLNYCPGRGSRNFKASRENEYIYARLTACFLRETIHARCQSFTAKHAIEFWVQRSEYLIWKFDRDASNLSSFA